MSSTVQNIGSEMSLEEWENVYWKKDFTPFHKTDGPHTLLIEFYDFIFGLKQRHRIFVPLCGKTKSMLWLASKGHDVVGLEYSPIAVKSFFDDNGLLFECSDHTNSKLKIFKAVGLNITIFQGDIFDANAQVLGTFDVIWDRGSFTSIYPPKRPRYLELMRSILEKSGSYMLNSFHFEAIHKGPPYHVETDILHKMADGMFDSKVLLSKKSPDWIVSGSELHSVLIKLTISK